MNYVRRYPKRNAVEGGHYDYVKRKIRKQNGKRKTWWY